MSQENLRVKNDLIRRWFWAFENDAAAFRDTLHPEIEWFPIDENRGRLHGIEAALRNRNEWLDTWDEHRIDLEEVAEEGDSIVVSVHITAKGKISGAEVAGAAAGTTRRCSSRSSPGGSPPPGS